MMEVITSLILSRALKKPGIDPQIAPAAIAATHATIQLAGDFSGKKKDTSRAANIPIVNWPDAPILKRPIL